MVSVLRVGAWHTVMVQGQLRQCRVPDWLSSDFLTTYMKVSAPLVVRHTTHPMVLDALNALKHEHHWRRT